MSIKHLRRLWTSAALCLCVLSATSPQARTAPDTSRPKQIPFNQTLWNTQKKLPTGEYPRAPMAPDLLRHYLTLGKDLDAVVAIVGQPDITLPESAFKIPTTDTAWKNTVTFIAYRLKPSRALKRNRFEYNLILAFDQDAKLLWRSIVKTKRHPATPDFETAPSLSKPSANAPFRPETSLLRKDPFMRQAIQRHDPSGK